MTKESCDKSQLWWVLFVFLLTALNTWFCLYYNIRGFVPFFNACVSLICAGAFAITIAVYILNKGDK